MDPSGLASLLRRALVLSLLGLCGVAWPGTARAWLDLRVVSDVATIELQDGGRARVSHELLLRARGGPLRSFSLQGVDRDLVPLPGASLVRAKSGRAAGIPIALQLKSEGELLTLDLSYEKGVGSGSYLVQFAYETDLAARGLVREHEGNTVVTWQGPRFADGIGSLKARFVAPRAEPPPSVWRGPGDAEDRSGSLDLFATDEGVVLSELQRSPEQDVLELTRPHAARGEQVTWRVLLGNGPEREAAPAAIPLTPSGRPVSAAPPGKSERARSTLIWLAGLAAGVLLSALVWCKRRWLAQQGKSSDRVLFLLPLPLGLRLGAIALGTATAVGLGLAEERATSGCSALLLVMILSLQHARAERPPPRGPGRWQVVDPKTVFGPQPRLRGAGQLLEGSTGPGLFVFLALGAVAVVFALRGIGSSPYHSAAIVAGLASVTPLFFTLGGARLSLPRVILEPARLEPYYSLLSKRRLPVELIARSLEGGEGEADEHRVRFQLPHATTGFDSLELALEWHHGGWFLAVRPVFITRVREGSPAHEALPRDAHWSRGRHRDERVALIRCAGSPSAVVATARELLQRLTAPTARPRGGNRRDAGALGRTQLGSRRPVTAA